MNQFLVICSALFFFGCQTIPSVNAPAPDSFAAFDSDLGQNVVLKAVNSKGVVYRVRFEKQEPKVDVKFWQEALNKKLTTEGYLILKSESKDIAQHPGGLINAVAPLTNGDYGFVVGFSVFDNHVLIVESAGPRAELDAASPKVIAAIEGIKTN